MTTINRLFPGDRIIRLQLLIIVAVAVLFSFTLGGSFYSVGNFQ